MMTVFCLAVAALGVSSAGVTVTVSASDYYPFQIPWDDSSPWPAVAAPQVHDAPAGKHGRIIARDGDLVFEDGGKVRLWGVGMGLSSRLPTSVPPEKEDATRLAAKLVKYGFNHVRFIGFDGTMPQVYESYARTGKIDDRTLDKFDYFISELVRVGIYYSISINNVSNIILDNVPDARRNTYPVRYKRYIGVRLIDDAAIDATLDWYDAFFRHRNPYTGKTYAEDAANVYVSAVNEDSIFHQYYSGFRYFDEVTGRLLRERFAEYLGKKYGDDAKLSSAWSARGRQGLLSGESIDRGGVELLPLGRLRHASPARVIDTAGFLLSLEQRYYDRVESVLRKAGYTGLFAGTNSWYGYLNLLASARDYVEIHGYFRHPKWDKSDGLVEYIDNSAFLDGSARATVESDAGNPFRLFFSMALSDKPVIVSEWNQAGWASNAYEAPLLMLAYASLQDFDVLDLHTYFSHPHPQPRREYATDSFSVSGNPVLMALSPTLSLAYVRGDIHSPEDTTVVRLASGREAFMADALMHGTAFGFFGQGGEVPLNLGFERKLRVLPYGNGPDRAMSLSARNSGVFASETGQIRWHYSDDKAGLLTVDTGKFQAIAGNCDARLGNLSAHVDVPAAVTAIALDDRALGDANRILFTAVANFRNTSMQLSADGDELVVAGPGTGPPMLRRLSGQICLDSTRQSSFRLRAIDWTGSGDELDSVVEHADGGRRICFDLERTASPWIYLEFAETGGGS